MIILLVLESIPGFFQWLSILCLAQGTICEALRDR